MFRFLRFTSRFDGATHVSPIRLEMNPSEPSPALFALPQIYAHFPMVQKQKDEQRSQNVRVGLNFSFRRLLDALVRLFAHKVLQRVSRLRSMARARPDSRTFTHQSTKNSMAFGQVGPSEKTVSGVAPANVIGRLR